MKNQYLIKSMQFALFAIFSMVITIKAQRNQFYDEAYVHIDNMLSGKEKYSFKKAVFSVEQSYYQGKIDTIAINNELKFLKSFAEQIIKSRELTYQGSDKDKVSKYAALYSIICQPIPVIVKDSTIQYKPFSYDFTDVFGHDDLPNLFVSKLIATKKGNCNSLPYLYKILAEELGVEANLALAPNHVYIKHNVKSLGWFNTELTSGIFPEDGWLMASGYIHLDAIRNGVFLKALDNKESLALCLFDLAQAYNRSFPSNDGEFLLKVLNKALEVYPNFAKARILKAETYKARFQQLMDRQDLKSGSSSNIKLALENPKAKEIYDLMLQEYSTLYKLGYRQMPEGMYLDWLVSLKTERNKYENKKLKNNFK
ncbi:hypothetical protein [Chryseobacterium aquaticum]|nr:hypothetical protein [Chryseobacterium aquaticum]